MPAGWLWKPVVAILIGLLIMLVAAFAFADLTTGAVIGLLIGTGTVLSSLAFLRPGSRPPADPDGHAQQLRNQQREFEEVRREVGKQLEEQTSRLERRQRELADRFIRFHEFLEYPDLEQNRLHAGDVVRLSEQDRQVQALLEDEAQRVYEKIRTNGYSVDGRIDVATIRHETFQLIQRVARVYAPDSTNPLMETSFEQLARAASRVCLHVLVVMEQLPLDVQQYNINALYGYVRRAVSGYGAYQKAAPWLTYLSRGAYIGRFAAGANPVAIGAWWLASEIGRRGAARLVENMVDRQAIAVLHDIVTVLGIEVSNVYGPGHRQRDPAWVLGTEIAELAQRFPPSRESLRESLRLVTALPLKSEYDRIYLYRCLAEHRSAGLRISDPAMLTRGQREQIARQLEHFLAEYIHGATQKEVTRWQDDVEQRLDLKLSLTSHRPKSASADQFRQILESIHVFLTSVISLAPDAAAQLLEHCALVRKLSSEQQRALFQALREEDGSARFEPPDLDPSDPATDLFLKDLVACVVHSDELTPMVESLLVETGAFFRRTATDMQALIGAASIARFRQRCTTDAALSELEAVAARTALNQIQPGEYVTALYTGICVGRPETAVMLPAAALLCLHNPQTDTGRLLLLDSDRDPPLLWTSEAPVQIVRKDGFLIDDCVLTGGNWVPEHGSTGDGITIAGTFRGGGFQKWFAPLIRQFSSKETQ